MGYAFVVSLSDLNVLKRRFLTNLKSGPIVCSSLQDISRLQQADEIYFVTSETSMCSTVYQELVVKAFAATAEQLNRSLLRLDDVSIPLGFQMLRSLPESIPKQSARS